MLIAKKIAKKKLVVYIVIMAVMLAGTILFVYKNYSLTSEKFKLTPGQPELDKLGGEPSLFGNNQAGEEKSVSEVKKADLGTEILNSPKFKNLKDNSIDQSIKSKSGVANPFQQEEEKETK